MKKYEAPQLEEKKVEIEDIIASSGFGNTAYDVEDDWGVPRV